MFSEVSYLLFTAYILRFCRKMILLQEIEYKKAKTEQVGLFGVLPRVEGT